jgi:hypothetical protein
MIINDIMPDLLEIHAFTGCDTFRTYFRVGNVGTLRMLQQNKSSLENW